MRKRDIRAQRKEKRELWEVDPEPDQEEMRLVHARNRSGTGEAV